MMIKITCPECGVDGSISWLESNYNGPYKCWKCRGLFKIVMVKNEVKSCEHLNEKEFDELQAIHSLKNKFRKE